MLASGASRTTPLALWGAITCWHTYKYKNYEFLVSYTVQIQSRKHTKNSFTPKDNCKSCIENFQSVTLPVKTRTQYNKIGEIPFYKKMTISVEFLGTSTSSFKVILHAIAFHKILQLKFDLIQVPWKTQVNCTFFLHPNNKGKFILEVKQITQNQITLHAAYLLTEFVNQMVIKIRVDFICLPLEFG